MTGVAPSLVTSDIQDLVEQLTSAPGGGPALVIGLLAALWSASGYVEEGRLTPAL